MLSVIMLSIIMLSVIMRIGIMRIGIMLSVIMLGVIMLSVIMRIGIMLSVIMRIAKGQLQFKNVNNFLNINIHSYLETSDGLSLIYISIFFILSTPVLIRHQW